VITITRVWLLLRLIFSAGDKISGKTFRHLTEVKKNIVRDATGDDQLTLLSLLLLNPAQQDKDLTLLTHVQSISKRLLKQNPD
jgi:hypothetical protein